MSTAVRRSTRRTAASAEPAQSASVQSTQQDSTPPPELPKKRAAAPKPKAKATSSAELESQTVKESQQTVTKTRATSRATVTPATTTTTTSTTIITATPPAPAAGRTTRNRKAAAAANGVASPLRSLEQVEKPAKPRPAWRRGHNRDPVTGKKITEVQSKPVQAEPSADDEKEEDVAPFFSQSKNTISLSPIDIDASVLRTANDDLRKENDDIRKKNDFLRGRVPELEHELALSAKDARESHHKALRPEALTYDQERQVEDLRSRLKQMEQEALARVEKSRSGHFPGHLTLSSSPLRASQVYANHEYSEFDDDLMLEAPQAEPAFVNGSESALALLHKIENAAKGPVRVSSSSINDSETFSDDHVAMEDSPQQSAKRTFTEVSATPERPVAKNEGFLSRSFSAFTSRFFSTPKAPSTAPPKPLPQQDTYTEALSVPPTPIGERVKTPSKRRTPANTLMRVLLKGVGRVEKQKAEAWAKQIIPELKNDPAFSEKRKRLAATVLFKDLTHFPSSKPWEAGFGDPLDGLDDDDVVPGWAVYLSMQAEEEEHQAKKHKNTHGATMGNDEIPSINEQFAARTTPKLYNSGGHSTSLYDYHPRRSIDPSPMFATPISHYDGDNVFKELRGHNTAAQIRESNRAVLKNVTKETVHTHDPSIGSFSVPDDSDEEDLSPENETTDTATTDAATTDAATTDAATSLWTQPPPPAPVPAHAPLPGGPVADAHSIPTTQQPDTEIERQRQRLMKHTPAKPSRLREATYPSPSLFSEAGTNSPLVATSAQVPADIASMFSDMPGAELIELDDECQAAFDELVSTDRFKQLLTANDWPAATLGYDSDEEDLSPISAQGFDNA